MRHIKRNIYNLSRGPLGILLLSKKNATIEINSDEPFVGISKVDHTEVVVEHDHLERKWIINRELSYAMREAEKKRKKK